jgi:hypothetical protein
MTYFCCLQTLDFIKINYCLTKTILKMKKALLFSFALIIGLAVMAQTVQLKNTVPAEKRVSEQAIGIEPVKANVPPVTPGPVMYNGDGADVVNVITLGTAANAYGYGYGGGQKTMVWADNNLGLITNIHRMGPGSQPGLSGYLAIDFGVNKAMTAADWTVNQQIYASTLNSGGDYYLDAARYPQGVVYDPSTKGVDESYFVYFAPNLSNTISTWGGYSYGVAKIMDPADTTKHMYWYAPPPYTYIPDGMMLNYDGSIVVSDLSQNWESGSLVYEGGIIINRGTWNATDMDFEYTMEVIDLPTYNNDRPAGTRIASNGNTVWVVALGCTGDQPPVGGVVEKYNPILFKSEDSGETWSDAYDVQLDGPTGIAEIVNDLLSDYRIEQLYTPPLPARDEIPYTTAFDCDIVVDKWGNPHVAVVVGVSADGFSIATGDSSYAVLDVFSPDGGETWCAAIMGHPTTFRGDFGDLTEDNRVNAAITPGGDRVFVTWLDTQVPGVTDNINPDVFARGFDLENSMLTAEPANVTFLSEVTQQAYFECTSYWTFESGDGDIIPIVTELLSDPNDPAAPVTFKYISDFSYMPADYTLAYEGCTFPVGVNDRKAESSISVYPNPASSMTSVKLNLITGGNVQIALTNMLGQQVVSMDKGFVQSGSHEYTVNLNRLNTGVYFCTVTINGEQHTQKLIVE